MNDLSISQISAVLNDVISQATGQKTLGAVDASQLVAVGQTQLLTKADPLMSAISQILSETIFSVRPYTEKFQDLEVSKMKFGNMVRKLQTCDSEFVDDDRLPLTDGQSVDMYKIRKDSVLQTNFYGETMYEDYWTTYRDQLDTAFSSADEFGRFISMVLQNHVDRRSQAREDLARMAVVNLIAGTINAGGNRVVHLITEYAAYSGAKVTVANYTDPTIYPGFIKWTYARVMEISRLMTERSTMFHTTLGKKLMRHTPRELQKMYILAPNKYHIQTEVLTDVFNKSELSGMDGELVTYWQSIDDGKRDAINVTPSILMPDGTAATGDAVSQAGIFGVIFDREAVGTTHVNEWSGTTPFNVRGGYWNTFFHATDRYVNDFTENSVVLLLD